MKNLIFKITAYSAGLALTAPLSVYTVFRGMTAGYALIAIPAVLLALLIQAVSAYRAARLLMESKLLGIQCVTVNGSRADGSQSRIEIEVVISGFGILIGGKVYIFNQKGVKLLSLEIGREQMRFYISKAKKQRSVTLLHEFTNEREARSFADRITRETGVIPEFSGWEEDSA